MSGVEWIGVALRALPLIGKAGSWLLERGMEVTIHPHTHPASGVPMKDAPTFILAIEPPTDPATVRLNPYSYSVFRLRLVNHRTDRQERVIAARIALKCRRWMFWRRTLFTLPVNDAGRSGSKPVTALLSAMSAPVEIECKAFADITNLPEWGDVRRVEEWLVLDMVGPIRRIERRIHTFERRDR